jgi:hypothetical protein
MFDESRVAMHGQMTTGDRSEPPWRWPLSVLLHARSEEPGAGKKKERLLFGSR